MDKTYVEIRISHPADRLIADVLVREQPYEEEDEEEEEPHSDDKDDDGDEGYSE